MAKIKIRGGVNAAAQTISFTTTDSAALAQAVAGAINSHPAAKLQLVTSGTVFLAAAVKAVVINGAGPVTVVAQSSSESVIGGAEGIGFYGAAGATEVIAFAGGANTISTGAGSNFTIATGAGNDLMFLNGSGSVDAGAGTNTLLVSDSVGTAVDITSYGTNDEIALSAGAATVGEGGTGATIFDGSGSALIADTGTADTIVGGTGAQTIFGGTNSLLFLGSSTNLVAGSTGPTGAETVVGVQGGAETVFAGQHDLVFANASTLMFIGSNAGATINGGSGYVTAVGSPGTSLSYYGTMGAPVLVAGVGDETLSAFSATSGVTFIAGSGSASLVGGAGDDTFFGGNGSNTLTGAAGANLFGFEKGQTGGSEVITDFKAGDGVVLLGYGSGEVANALATATTSAAGTTITLADNTKVIFSGSPTLNSTNVTGF